MSLEHYDETTSIHFTGIPSGQEDFLKAKENLDMLLRNCPCDSNCRLRISKTSQGMFEGILEVSFQNKSFEIKHQGKCVKDLQSFLFEQMNQKLDEWKLERSEEDITGTIKLESLFMEKSKKPRKKS